MVLIDAKWTIYAYLYVPEDSQSVAKEKRVSGHCLRYQSVEFAGGVEQSRTAIPGLLHGFIMWP